MLSGITARYADHAARHPDKPAIVLDGVSIGWGEFHASIERIAAALAASTPPAAGLALHLPNGLALVWLALAAARAGREAQILDADWPRAIVTQVIEQLGSARTFSFDPLLRAHAVSIIAESGAPADAIVAALGGALDLPPAPVATAQAPFYVGMTSGTTGLPKAYRRDHASWLASFDADAVEFGITADDVVLAPGQLSHSLFFYALAHALHVGATAVLCRRFRPPQALALAQRHHATVLYGVPTQLQMLAETAHANALALPRLRWILSTGAKWFDRGSPAVRRLAPNARCAEFYGASETSFIAVAKDGEGAPPQSVGRAFHGVRLSIRDDQGRECPPDVPGNVHVASPMLFSGYALGDAAQAMRAADGFMTVGDVGYRDSDGFLHLVGRARRMIVTAGKNVYPEEIEAVLTRHPGVLHAAVLALSDAKRGERLVAILRLREDAALAARDLIAYARTALPLYKIPRRLAALHDWPLTRSGKTDFETVRRRWDAGECKPLP